MPHPVQNAIFEWEEGTRRLAEAPDPERVRLERSADAVHEELRRRLGSSFTVEELAELYASGTDWAADIAARWGAGVDASGVVDAAFGRYVREAANFAGGRHRGMSERL